MSECVVGVGESVIVLDVLDECGVCVDECFACLNVLLGALLLGWVHCCLAGCLDA